MIDAEQSEWEWAQPKSASGAPRKFTLPEVARPASQGQGPGEVHGDWRKRLADVFPSILRQGPEDGTQVSCGAASANWAGGGKGESIAAELSGQFWDECSTDPGMNRWENFLKEECGKAEERGRILGYESGLAIAQQELERRHDSERLNLQASIAALVDGFAYECETYFHELEREVASLSLAIAARILRREVQTDPLLLTGAVRAALGQLSGSTVVRLCVPARDEAMWRESLERIPGLKQQPQVIGDQGMQRGQCRLESELGLADLGLWTQLKEIERGFFEGNEDVAGAFSLDNRSINENREEAVATEAVGKAAAQGAGHRGRPGGIGQTEDELPAASARERTGTRGD